MNLFTGLLALIYGLIIKPIKSLFTFADREKRREDLRFEFELRRQEIYVQKLKELEDLQYSHAWRLSDLYQWYERELSKI